MKNFPSVTIQTGTYNADLKTFRRALESVKRQSYTRIIEHILMDGGSTNGTVALAKSYGCKIISRPDLQRQEQVRFSLGHTIAKGDLILVLESDNILPTKDWLEEMVKPFLENKEIVCAYSIHNTYRKDMNPSTRYAALFGSPEPTLYYLQKTEKIPYTQKDYDKGEIIKKDKNYAIVRFTSDNLPTMGDNGHLFLRSAMDKVNKNSDSYTHVDAFADMLKIGYDTYAVVNNSVIHLARSGIFEIIKRRVYVKELFYDERRGKRRYLVYNPQSARDRRNLIKFILFSLTFVVPLVDSIRGYVKIRDHAWFIHPIFCFLIVMGYGISEIKFAFKKIR